jgi:hypothetical protein
MEQQEAVQLEQQAGQQQMVTEALAVQQQVQGRAQQAPWCSSTHRQQHCLQQQPCS